ILALAVAFFVPGIAAIVIAAFFPKPGAIRGDELDPLNPFRALPEIQLRHDRAHRPAMLAWQGLALPGVREKYVVIIEISERKVRRVIVIGMKHDEARLWLRLREAEDVLCANAVPLIVEARPGGNAVNIGDVAELRLNLKFGPTPIELVLDQAIDRETPALWLDPGLNPEIEHGPIAHLMLAGRQTLAARRSMPGQEPAVAGPAFL